jgi:signal recognition particle GTPase
MHEVLVIFRFLRTANDSGSTSSLPSIGPSLHQLHCLLTCVLSFVGGTVLYHNQPNSLRTLAQDNKENQRDLVNSFILSVLLGEGKNVQASSGEGPRREILSRSNQSPVVVEWLDGSTTTAGDGASSEERRNWIALAVYPEVAIRKLHGVDALLSSLMRRYALYYEHHCKKIIDQGGENPQYQNMELAVPPPQEFDSAFQTILRRFQDQLAAANTSSTSISSLEKRHNNNKSNKQQSQNATKKGKEKTVWHDGKQKITKAALAELDMSKDKDDTLPGTHGTDGIREDARAIAEAKAAYMPTEGEKPAWEEEDEVLDDSDMNWNIDNQGDRDEEDNSLNPSWKRGFFSKLLSPNSPLTKSDLDSPLKQMQLLLTSKNVAPSTAQAICEIVEKQLIGKRVGTLVGVKRAVRHALEDAVERILRPELGGVGGRAGVTRGKTVDVLRGVVEKRERQKSGGFLGLAGSAAGKGRPYVIVMIGINGTFTSFVEPVGYLAFLIM